MSLHEEERQKEWAPENGRERTKYFIEKVRKINEERLVKTGGKSRASVVTYGCQMNEADSEKIVGLLYEMGYNKAVEQKSADIIIYNTCCVRENAENKIFGNLGRLKNYKKYNSNLKIALCGCMIQQDNIVELIKSKYRYVDILFGTFNIHRLPELLYTSLTTNEPVIDVWNERGDADEDLPSLRKHKWKAGVNIMYGCDNFCAYCIVPYVRGRERSRGPDEIINQIKRLSEDGVKEVLLIGQNVNSYGKGLSDKVSFSELLRRVSGINGIERIRFMTSHPKDFSDELIAAIASSGKICNHVHLPLQSGSTDILKRMNRKYTKEQYLSLADKIKESIPGVNITTDIIVGFPGETEKDFEDTLDVVERVRFSSAFTFIYSKRSGTPAANMEQLEQGVISERFNRLLELQNKIVFEQNERYVGKTTEILIEDISAKNDGTVSGRTEGNVIVHIKGEKELIGSIVKVKVTKNRAFFLEGELEA